MNEPDAPYASETEAVEDSEEKETVLSMAEIEVMLSDSSFD